MSPELEKQLCRDFPATYAALTERTIYDFEELLKVDLLHSAHITSFGIEHGDGWYGIARRFADRARLQAHRFLHYSAERKMGCIEDLLQLPAWR